MVTLPQASSAVKVLVLDLKHSPMTAPSMKVIEGFPLASVAKAVPKAVSMAVAVGLQPRGIVAKLLVNEGGVTSYPHVTVLDAMEILPDASAAVKVLVCDL